MRFFLGWTAVAICVCVAPQAKAQSGGAAANCLPWPSTFVPFDSVYYVSSPNANGDKLVVGKMSMNAYMMLRSQIPAPAFTNQEFCGSVRLGPSLYAHAYVPTQNDWWGDFRTTQIVIHDPFTSSNPANGLPFAANIIPMSRIPDPFAWRITSQAPTLPISPTPLRFVPVNPCRIADTREPAGPFGAPMLASNTTRDFAIPAAPCGIPAGARAYSLNFTVVPQGKLDYLTVFPAGQSQPLASVLNSYNGRVKANAAIIPAGTNGGISVFVTDDTHVIIDANGYFVPDSDTTALAFYPLTPCRVVDTREALGTFGAPILSPGQERSFPVLSSNCGVPPEAKAYALNYTVIPNGPLTYLTSWPSGRARPLVSTLNAPTGSITANAAIVPAGDDGSISVYATGETHFILDIDGYFAPAGANGLSLYTLAPCRVYDSRTQFGAWSYGAGYINVSNTACGALPNARSVLLNSTVVPVTSLLYLTLWGDGGTARPIASTLNAPDGKVTSNLAFVPTTSGSISAFVTDPTQLIMDLSGYFAP